VTGTTVVHASSPENTSYPLCRATKFRHVTICIENVTCESCILMLDGRGGPGALLAPIGLDARAAAGRT
jgi:hypothetical protein